jgi:hypothetical protein
MMVIMVILGVLDDGYYGYLERTGEYHEYYITWPYMTF